MLDPVDSQGELSRWRVCLHPSLCVCVWVSPWHIHTNPFYSTGSRLRQSKEYNHVVAASTHAIEMDMKLGKILTELTVPDDSITTLSTTKIISIEYKLHILFDMRARTGFLEGRNRRTVNKKLRGKITGKPGGFEVEVPVVIGTLYDSTHVPGTISNIPSPGTTSLAIPSPASNSIRTHCVGKMHMPSSPEGTHEAPSTQHASHSSFHSIPITHGRQASEPVLGLATTRGLVQPVRHQTAHYFPTPSAPIDSHRESKELPSLPQVPYHPPSPPMSSPSSSSSSNHTPSSSYQPPRLPYRENSTFSASSSSSSPISTTPNGYPNEKHISMPHQLIHSPNAHVVAPTAPQAVSLGLGPASPGICHSSVSTPISSSGDYFQIVSKQPLGYGAFASSPMSTSPSGQHAYVPQTTYIPNASTSLPPSHSRNNNHSWSSSPSSSSGGSSSMAPLRSPQFIPLPTPRNPHAVRPESLQAAPPYTPT